MSKKGRKKSSNKKVGKSGRTTTSPNLTFESDQLPDSFTRQLESDHPLYAQSLLEALHTTQPPSIRLNPLKAHQIEESVYTEHLPIMSETVPWEPMGRYLSDRPSFTLDPLFHAGMYYVQEASSMTIGAVVRQIRKHLRGMIRVLDLSAAPGGKSTHLASVLSENDLLVCNEVIRSRATILTENITKWGAANVVVTGNDPDHFTGLGPWFDVVIVDAPCSGEGLFRKDPAAIAHWSPDAVQHCALRQNRILDAVWPVIKPGGYLIYSTCTYNRDENDDQIARLLRQGDATSHRIDSSVFSGVVEECMRVETEKWTEFGLETDTMPFWMYRCLPGQIRGEGLTFSVLQKSDHAPVDWSGSNYYSKNKLERCEANALATFLRNDTEWVGVRNEKREWIVPQNLQDHIIQLSETLNILHAGIEAGDASRPPHGLAMSASLKRGFIPEIELDRTDALQYLRRESIAIDPGYEGIQMMCYKGVPLGFGKAVRGRLNNLYPMEWRIRMR